MLHKFYVVNDDVYFREDGILGRAYTYKCNGILVRKGLGHPENRTGCKSKWNYKNVPDWVNNHCFQNNDCENGSPWLSSILDKKGKSQRKYSPYGQHRKNVKKITETEHREHRH